MEPKTNNKKNIWKFVGCNEIYKEPLNEDWSESIKYKEWWYENCSGYNGTGSFYLRFVQII